MGRWGGGREQRVNMLIGKVYLRQRSKTCELKFGVTNILNILLVECLVSEWLHSGNFGQLFCITLPHGRGALPVQRIVYQSVSWFATKFGGSFPRGMRCFGCTSPGSSDGFFCVHSWAEPRCDSNRQGKGCQKESSAKSEHFLLLLEHVLPQAEWLGWGLRMALPAGCSVLRKEQEWSSVSFNSMRVSTIIPCQAPGSSRTLFPLSAGEWGEKDP